MKKIILSLSLFLGLNSYAQDYYHAIGAAYNIGLYNLSYTSVSQNIDLGITSTLGCPMIVYKATLAFELSRSSSFAVTAYPGVGGFISSQSGSYVGYQLPVLGEMYFGDVDDANFNFGAGFFYGGILADGSGGAIMGPQASIGGQFEFRDNLIGLRGYYTYGVNKSRDLPSDAENVTDTKSLFGVSVHYLLGQ